MNRTWSVAARLGRPGQVLVVAVAALLVAGTGAAVGMAAGSNAGPANSWRAPASVSGSSPVATPTQPCGGWDCALADHFGATEALVASKRGTLEIVVRDRTTGQVWRSGDTAHPVWTASTIKLALAADILVRARSGEITLTVRMRDSIADMLDFSANWAATSLWAVYGGPTALERYRSTFGMAGVHFPTGEHAWGAVKCTAEDLAALMSYILNSMHQADRNFIVGAMRKVHQVQRWGVWAAGAALKPGVKDGWNVELNPAGERGWVVSSVGFAGPAERYVVAVMYELEPGTQEPGNTIRDGVSAVSDVVATFFGAKVPASIPSVSLLLNPPGLTPTKSPTPSPAATPGSSQPTPSPGAAPS